MESINYVVVSRVYYQLHTSTEYVWFLLLNTY